MWKRIYDQFYYWITVKEGSYVLSFTEGKLDGLLEPGRYRRRVGRQSEVTYRTSSVDFEISKYSAMTRDRGSIVFNLRIRWRVADPVRYFGSGGEPSNALRTAGQAMIMHWTGERTVEEVIGASADVEEAVRRAMAPVADEYGVEILQVRLWDCSLTGGLSHAYAKRLKVSVDAQTALERARSEVAVARSLLNVARMMRDHEGLLELRSLMEGKTRIALNFNNERSKATAGAATDKSTSESAERASTGGTDAGG